MNVDCDVLVVGAGISGLTAAFTLAQQGLRVEVIDAAPRPGGVIGTARSGGFLYERGPNSVLDSNPLIGNLLARLDITGKRVEMRKEASKRFVVRNGKLVALPTSPSTFLTTSLFTPRAKLRLMKEPFIARASADAEESVAQFVERRLGREVLDYAIEPFVAGIYAGDPAELSVAAAFPRLHALEQRYGGLIKGQILGARERSQQGAQPRNKATSFTFHDGMQTLTDSLARALGRIQAHTRATALRRADGAFVVSLQSGSALAQMRARAVVLAVPADCAAVLVRTFAVDAAHALNEIPYAAVASVARAYLRARVSHPLDGFGFLVPRVEKRCILGTLFSSSMFENRAPEDTVLLTTFIGGRRDPALAVSSAEQIDEIVSAELTALVGASGPPRLSVVTQWPRAIPQYTLGHLQRIARAEQAETVLPGLFLCASYRGGVSVGDCIKSSHERAEAVAEYLRNSGVSPR